MLFMQSVDEEKAFVLGMVEKANEKGESVDLGTVTESFVEKHDSSRKPSLFDAIRQLKAEGVIRLESHDSEVVISLP